MKRNEVERHAPEARTDTNLPLDESMLDSFTASDPATLVKGSDLRGLIAQARAALTLRARVAECVRAAAAVTGTDAEMCATEAGADTNHGVVLAALDWQAKRVAELEAANVAATMAYADARVQAGENAATANALRDALARIYHWPGISDESDVLDMVQKTLAAHPAADLAAYRANVLKEASNWVQSQHTAPHFTEQLRYTIAEGIDALAAQAQEVTK